MRIPRIPLIWLTAAIFALLLSPAHAEQTVLRLATTTSTDNSGLLKYLLPAFEKSSGYQVQVVAVGTGKALRMGQDGDADVLLVHAPPAEEKFMASDYGVNRRYVMYNDFIIVGPKNDPAGIRGTRDARAALEKIAKTRSVFVSRGDDSGTNKKEKVLWKETGINPQGDWYKAAGQGMGKVLLMTDELHGYTLVDRATWLALQSKVGLQIAVQGDEQLFNPYHVIAVNPARYPEVNYTGAMALISWLTSVEGQRLVAQFRVAGQELFVPTAIPAKVAAEGKP
ncbi:MAG TPA: substrate-binding domain-containing protein [Candidatus Methylomirabilis sp.]|nr:substrate-binding domain-containing protein [Candidatus Methylomirabilis sp.]